MNNILIIGKYGQLAQYFSKLNSDDKITLLDRTQIDITKQDILEKKVKALSPTHIINTSAYHVLSQCEEFPEKAFEINTVAVLNLAKLCKIQDIKLITYSTDYVFDGTNTSPYTETDTPNPLQVHGISKLAGEYAARSYYPEGTTIIRTNGLYGGKTGSTDKKGNFVLTILKAAQTQPDIEIRASMTVSPTYAKDLAEATYALIKSSAKPDLYHLVNEGACTWQEFGQKILEYAKINKHIKKPETKKREQINRPDYSALSNTKAKKLGIILRPWQEALQEYITTEYA